LAALLLARPAWARSYGCKSRRKQVTASEAKRDALETVARQRKTAEEELRREGEAMPNITQGLEGEYLQTSLQSYRNKGEKGVKSARKSLNLNGGRGRNRIFNQTYIQRHAGQRMTP
jgi:hypothetical protein